METQTMEREKTKFGEADSSRFQPIDGNGESAFLDGTVVPILKQLPDTTWEFIGTGFFITINGVLATARHVLTDILDDKGIPRCPLAVFHFLQNGIYLKRPVLRFSVHQKADVAIAVVAPVKNNNTGAMINNKIPTLSTAPLEIGETVFTYAYPNTVLVTGVPQQIHFNPRNYEGKIVEFYPTGRDSVLLPNPCYQTSIAIHGGASGGPVFDTQGKVRGINSTGFPAFPDVSFISRTEELLPLQVTDIALQPGLAPESVSIARLAELGHVFMER
jgi:S1-C subfamily serine protease